MGKQKEKEIILEKILKQIKENNKLVFMQDVYQVMGMSRSVFYKLFPATSKEHKSIDEALEANRTLMKREIRDRLSENKNVVALLCLYRLLATPEERKALSQKEYEDKEAKNANNEIELKIE